MARANLQHAMIHATESQSGWIKAVRLAARMERDPAALQEALQFAHERCCDEQLCAVGATVGTDNAVELAEKVDWTKIVALIIKYLPAILALFGL